MKQESYSLLLELDESDRTWWLESAVEEEVSAGTVVLSEGTSADSFYILLKGCLGVFVQALASQCLEHVGPGALLGEMSFVDGQTRSASVVAVEDSTVLRMPHAAVRARADLDPAFGCRFYRSLAALISRRLRRAHHAIPRASTQTADGVWSLLSQPLKELKQLLSDVEKKATRNYGEVSSEDAQRVRQYFDVLIAGLNEVCGERSAAAASVREVLGQQAHQEFLPYLLLTELAARMYSKPRGYAGDFYTIEQIYQSVTGGVGSIGPLIDACVTHSAAAQAVRNRRPLLAAEIQATVDSCGPQAAVTSLACGPAQEIFDVFAQLGDRSRLKATCLDLDLQALAFVSERLEKLKLRKHVDLRNENLIYLALGRKQLDLPPQDLIYSIGLIDYFNDEMVVRLLDWIYSELKPGGRAILGNFHPRNPSKGMMDYILDWKLIHRDEEDMNRLFAGSRFGRPCTRIMFEEAGVNLFAECVRTPE